MQSCLQDRRNRQTRKKFRSKQLLSDLFLQNYSLLALIVPYLSFASVFMFLKIDSDSFVNWRRWATEEIV